MLPNLILQRLHQWLLAVVMAFALCAVSVAPVLAHESATASTWFDSVIERVKSTWVDGQPELYLPVHTYHVRFAYSKEQIDEFNETPLGLGIGKGTYDANGDWHGLYVMEFQASHFKPEYVTGYGYKTYWPLFDQLKFGLGYTSFVTTRADIGHYTPIPGVLPMAALEYQRYAFNAVFVPGGHGFGNILLFFGTAHF